MLRSIVFLCVMQLIGTTAIAQSQTPWLLAQSSMSWKDILNKAGRGDETFGPNPLKQFFPPTTPSDPESIESPRAPVPVQHVAASFDCKSPKNPNEKLICRSTELSELDGNMADLFNSVLSRLDNTDRQKLQNSQRSWLKKRLDCGDDFICTKEAYSERIERLKSVLAKLSGAVEQCRVSDPEPPLNVRATPNGTTVGSLANDTMVVVLDYNGDKSWVFVGRYEDRFPIGWVFEKYLNCRGDVDRGVGSPSITTYRCSLLRKFPETKREDKDPVVDTTVIVAYDQKGERFVGMEVRHQLQSGVIHKRHEQYRDYKTSVTDSEDSTSWKWSGTFATNRALSMKGELTGGEGTYYYTEELTANGKLDWSGIWSCREHH